MTEKIKILWVLSRSSIRLTIPQSRCPSQRHFAAAAFFWRGRKLLAMDWTGSRDNNCGLGSMSSTLLNCSLHFHCFGSKHPKVVALHTLHLPQNHQGPHYHRITKLTSNERRDFVPERNSNSLDVEYPSLSFPERNAAAEGSSINYLQADTTTLFDLVGKM